MEPAATGLGATDKDKVPEETVTETDLDMPPQEAVMRAVPVVNELNVTVATPLVFVTAVEELSSPRVVVKLTGTFTAISPITSRTVTVMVDLTADFAAIKAGAAVIVI